MARRPVISQLPSDLKRIAPATRARAITLEDVSESESESAEVITVPYGATLYVGTEGDLKVTPVFSTAPVVLKGVVGFVPVSVKTIHADETTARDIVALY